MTNAQPDHRTVIAAALDDWWITTDPAEPFHAPAVADHVDTYLAGLGYQIRPTSQTGKPMITRVPSRGDIAFGIVLSLLSVLAATQAAFRNHFWWAVVGYVLTLILARDTAGDIRDRRDYQRPLNHLDSELP
jgi:hypothetical protein